MMNIKTPVSYLYVQANHDSKVVWASGELLFLLSSTGNEKTYVQMAAN